MVEFSQQRLDLLEFLLGLLDRGLAVRQALVLIWLVLGACLILHGTEVLDLLARIFHLGKAESCR